MRLKRLFDIVCASLGLIILAPLFIIIALLIKATSKGPVFFCQNRVGKNGVIFSIYKFRTMVDKARGLLITVGDDSRITQFGRLLRKAKFDELPQLLNVLAGDMSLVGPRPEIPYYVNLYPREVRQIVLSVKPGITDWASIVNIDENKLLAKSANPEAAYIDEILPQKLDLAVKYVKTRTFFLDCVIIIKTVKKIFMR